MLSDYRLNKTYKMLRKKLPCPIGNLLALIRTEIKNPVPLSFIHKLRAYKNGFNSRYYRLYNLENKDNLEDYLSDSAFTSTIFINPNPDILDNKKAFYDYMSNKGFGRYVPEVFGVIKNGKFIGDESLESYLDKRKKIVMKPYASYAGSGVYICEIEKNKVIMKGKKRKSMKFEKFKSKVQEFDEYIVTEFCEQASFLNDIYPHSSNTIRILSMNPQDKKPFIPTAILRIGRKKSGFLDNIDQGGLTANINLENGKLSSAATVPLSGEAEWYDKHPDTSTQIKGSKIPAWNQIKKELLAIVTKLPELKYVGWDILLTNENGKFVIIEGNSCPGIWPHQVHKPLLEDPHARDFYQENGVCLKL